MHGLQWLPAGGSCRIAAIFCLRPEVKLFQFISSSESIYVFKNKNNKFIAVVCRQFRVEPWAIHTNHRQESAQEQESVQQSHRSIPRSLVIRQRRPISSLSGLMSATLGLTACNLQTFLISLSWSPRLRASNCNSHASWAGLPGRKSTSRNIGLPPLKGALQRHIQTFNRRLPELRW